MIKMSNAGQAGLEHGFCQRRSRLYAPAVGFKYRLHDAQAKSRPLIRQNYHCYFTGFPCWLVFLNIDINLPGAMLAAVVQTVGLRAMTVIPES